MVEIGQYFKPDDPASSGAHSGSVADLGATPSNANGPVSDAVAGEENPELTTATDVDPPVSNETSAPQQTPEIPVREETIVGPDHRLITVYSAPSKSTPVAALQQYNEDDYEPTVAHAKLHQQRLLARSNNVRLPSDAETEAMAKEKAVKQAAVKEIAIRVRFPDQSSVIATFNNMDTGLTLYEHARGVIVAEQEPFSIVYLAPGGSKTVPNSADVRLIKDLGFAGRMLVNFHWNDNASTEARTRPVLKEQYSSKAQELKVPEVADSEPTKKENSNSGASEDKVQTKEAGKAKGGVPKWLKLPGKK